MSVLIYASLWDKFLEEVFISSPNILDLLCSPLMFAPFTGLAGTHKIILKSNQADARLDKFHPKAVQQSKHCQMQVYLAGQQLYLSELVFGSKWLVH